MVIYFAKRAVRLSSFFDYEVVTGMGRQFKQMNCGSVIEAILVILQRRFEKSSKFLSEQIEEALSQLRDPDFIQKHLPDSTLQKDLEL